MNPLNPSVALRAAPRPTGAARRGRALPSARSTPSAAAIACSPSGVSTHPAAPRASTRPPSASSSAPMRRAMVVWLSPSSVGGGRVPSGARDGEQHEQVVWARPATGQRRHGHPCILAHPGRASTEARRLRRRAGAGRRRRRRRARRRRARPTRARAARHPATARASSSRVDRTVRRPQLAHHEAAHLPVGSLEPRLPGLARSVVRRVPGAAPRARRGDGARVARRGPRGAHRRPELHRRGVERARRGIRLGKQRATSPRGRAPSTADPAGPGRARRARSRGACWCRRPDAAGRTRTRRSRAPCTGRRPAARAGRRGPTGTSPPWRSTISTAARCSQRARRG